MGLLYILQNIAHKTKPQDRASMSLFNKLHSEFQDVGTLTDYHLLA